MLTSPNINQRAPINLIYLAQKIYTNYISIHCKLLSSYINYCHFFIINIPIPLIFLNIFHLKGNVIPLELYTYHISLLLLPILFSYLDISYQVSYLINKFEKHVPPDRLAFRQCLYLSV